MLVVHSEEEVKGRQTGRPQLPALELASAYRCCYQPPPIAPCLPTSPHEDRDPFLHFFNSQERPDVAYHTVAVDFLPPPLVGAGMARVAASLAAGEARAGGGGLCRISVGA